MASTIKTHRKCTTKAPPRAARRENWDWAGERLLAFREEGEGEESLLAPDYFSSSSSSSSSIRSSSDLLLLLCHCAYNASLFTRPCKLLHGHVVCNMHGCPVLLSRSTCPGWVKHSPCFRACLIPLLVSLGLHAPFTRSRTRQSHSPTPT